MYRSNAALDLSASTSQPSTSTCDEPPYSVSAQPTRKMPKFVLDEEARRLFEQPSVNREDATVTISADENRKLLASLFTDDETPTNRPSSDDEPTLDAPAPVSGTRETEPAPAMAPAPVAARPRGLRSLVLTTPMPTRAVTPSFARHSRPVEMPPLAPVSPLAPMPLPWVAPAAFVGPSVPSCRPMVTPATPAVTPVRPVVATAVHVPKRNQATYLVAGIWTLALSLLAVLTFIAASA